MTRTLVALVLTALSLPASALPLLGLNDPENNSGDYNYSVLNPLVLQVSLQNTSNYDARITGFGFDVYDGFAVALGSVSGTLNDGDWRFSFDAIPGSGDRDAFAITGANLWGGDPRSGITAGSTGTFDFLGIFSESASVRDMVVRFQRTGPTGEGSDRGVSVPEPATLALMVFGLGLLVFVRRRRQGCSVVGHASA